LEKYQEDIKKFLENLNPSQKSVFIAGRRCGKTQFFKMIQEANKKLTENKK